MQMRVRVSAILAALFALTALAQSTLNNDAIIKMVKAGLSEDLVVTTIKAQPGKYSTTTDDLIALKKAGVSDKVVAAMMMAGTSAPAGAAPAAAPAAPPPAAEPGDLPKDVEIGVYYRKAGQWEEMLPEVVNWKTGGVMKHIATAGVVKGDVNGHIEGPHSRNSLALPVEVLIYAPEGVAITEYQLLHLHENTDNREFRTVTGGVMHVSGGATRDIIPFEGKKIAPRTYKVLLPATLGAGEFGFLPPGGSMSSSNTSLGKMYTFRIME
jgi:hypothetical protein